MITYFVFENEKTVKKLEFDNVLNLAQLERELEEEYEYFFDSLEDLKEYFYIELNHLKANFEL